MMEIIFDDVGSYPLPVNSEEIVRDVMIQKIDSGLEVPTYPQLRDMNDQFLVFILDEKYTDEPFLVDYEGANISELDVIENVAKEYYELNGEALRVKVCVTGPIELYYQQFSSIYEDILGNFAKSVNRFIRRNFRQTKYMETSTTSIDEPSLGINPQFMIGEDELIKVMEMSTSQSKADVQIHLHSPLYYRSLVEVDGLDIIGVESASDPSKLQLIDERDLETHDKYLRVGVSRTDIDGILAEFGLNVEESIRLSENVYRIRERLEKAYSIFGDRIRYAGPDCGLGTWPSQESAFSLLKNTGEAIKSFKQNDQGH